MSILCAVDVSWARSLHPHSSQYQLADVVENEKHKEKKGEKTQNAIKKVIDDV